MVINLFFLSEGIFSYFGFWIDFVMEDSFGVFCVEFDLFSVVIFYVGVGVRISKMDVVVGNFEIIGNFGSYIYVFVW